MTAEPCIHERRLPDAGSRIGPLVQVLVRRGYQCWHLRGPRAASPYAATGSGSASDSSSLRARR
jgi:hypothetical protein